MYRALYVLSGLFKTLSCFYGSYDCLLHCLRNVFEGALVEPLLAFRVLVTLSFIFYLCSKLNIVEEQNYGEICGALSRIIKTF